MPYVNIGDSRLYYESHGEGPALVLAHGVGGNHASWYLQLRYFSGTHRVVTFDHRGFGNSTDIECLGQAAFVDDLHAIVEHAGLDRFSLVGQSMGGGTCIAYACRHPSRVTALVLADSLTSMKVPKSVEGVVAAAREATATLSQIERVLGVTTRALHPELATLYEQIATFNAVTIKTLKRSTVSLSPQDLSETRIPSLFVAGEEDALFPPVAIRAFADEVAGATYREIARAGHSAYFEDSEQFNDIVNRWLKAIYDKQSLSRSAEALPIGNPMISSGDS